MKRALPHLLFGALTLAVFWRFLVLGETLYDTRILAAHLGKPVPQEASDWRPAVDRGDTALLLPWLHRLYGDGLRQGELRLWNPRLFFGYPLYADTMVHPFYPPHLILFALFRPECAYELTLLLHFFFSGAAMFWLLRGVGRSPAASTAGGLLWMLLGYNSLWFSTGILEGVNVFGPLALLAIHRGLGARDLSRASLAGAAMGLAVLGSHPQYALHAFLFLFALILARERNLFAAKFAGIFAAFTLGVGLAAILARLETIQEGLRIPGADFALVYDHPWRAAGTVFSLVLEKMIPHHDPLVRSELSIYAGLAAVALALTGAIRAWRDPLGRFLAIFGAAALLFAFVRPLGEILQWVPILKLSMPSRWVHVLGFCLVVLAAFGWDSLAERPGRVPLVLAAAAALLLLTLPLYVFHLRMGRLLETGAGFALAVAAAFAIRPQPRLACSLAFAALLVDLLPPFLHWNSHADPAVLHEEPEVVRRMREAEREPFRIARSMGPVYGGPNPWILSISNNLLALRGLEAPAGYDAIAPARSVEYLLQAGGGAVGSGRVLFVPGTSPELAVANVKYLLWPPGHALEKFVKVGEWDALCLYRNDGALPRATLSKPGSVTWTSRTTDRIELSVDASADSVLRLSDTYYPGWVAEMDGREVPIREINIAFRAVDVPAGQHVVTFAFRPACAREGLLGSALFALLAAAWVLHARRGSTRPT